MVNYQNGRIYQIVNFTTGKRYIGCTTEVDLKKRLSYHVRHYKKCLSDPWNHTWCPEFDVYEGGLYDISLLQLAPSENIDELHAWTRNLIYNTDCVNKTK